MTSSEGSEPNQRRTVGILLFDEVEVLDFTGPFEVFFAARANGQKDNDPPLFDVITIAEETSHIRCSGDLLVRPQYTIDDHPTIDILVVPGGDGTRREMHNRRLLNWITAQNQRTEITMSVCTGALLLAECGILDGLQATTHWYRVELMRDRYPTVETRCDVRLVDAEHVMTSAGISAGIDLALHVVERLHGESTAAWTARRMEHLWSEQYRSVFESSADAILIVNPSGRIVVANNTACQLFCYARDEIVGVDVATLAPAELRDEVVAHLSTIPRASSAEIRFVCQRKDGTEFHAEARSTLFEYHGVPHVLSMIRDISARVEAEEAVRQERQRLSRDLHDSVSQALYGIALAAKTGRSMVNVDSAELAAPLDFIVEQAERGLAEMRALIFELRPEVLEQEGLVAAMSRRAAAFEARHRVHLELALCAEPSAPPAVKEALYRISQEAMQNTIKHAQASEICLFLRCTDESIILVIQDNGKGFDTSGSFPGHLGLQSMRERASQFGGTIEMESAVGIGTSITVRMPIAAGVIATPTAVS